MSLLKIAIAGPTGRMGKALIQSINANPNVKLTGALSHADSESISLDAGLTVGIDTGTKITCNIDDVLKNCDVLIDFTRPEYSLELLERAKHFNTKLVIGTTGFDERGKQAIKLASEMTSIVFAANFSVGVNLTFHILETVAKTLNEGYDIEIIEAHHRHKVDAPSGTALRMGEVIADSLNRNLEECAVYGRQGHTGERKAETIGFSTIRAGDIVGDHTALFASEGERVEITHKASNRLTFSAGAVRAAIWLKNKEKGLFDMQDVLGLSNQS